MVDHYRKEDREFLSFISKFAIGVVFFTLALGIIYIGIGPYVANFREGEIAPATLYAPFNFSYTTGVDEAKTALVRQRAIESVAPVYDIIKDILTQARSSLDKSDEDMKENMSKLLSLIYDSYILDSQERRELSQKKKDSIIVRDPRGLLRKTIRISDILTRDDIRKRFGARAEELFPKNAKLKDAALETVKDFVRPNLALNEDETRKSEEAVSKSINPIYEFQEIKKNEVIVVRGQRITKAHLAMLRELSRFHGRTDIISYVLGMALFVFVLIAIFYTYLRRTEPKTSDNLKYIGMIGILSLILIAVCKTVSLSSLNNYVVPFASTTMLIAILVSSNAAVISGVLLSVICGVIFGGKLDVMLVSLVSGLVGIYAVRNLRSRFQIILAGFEAGIASLAVIVAVGLQNNVQAAAYLYNGALGMLNGVMSSFFVMGLLPIMEHIFKVSTNITLLELSDMSHPLLKELALKAPGTYLHSHLVGNLAEAACEAIGANALLARIGSYYHDIGKIIKAEYFSENETTFKSKHEKLRPSMSSLVIGNHVKEGLDLARKYHLNTQIIDIIQQHHGTSLMYFFYKRALEDMNGDGPLKEQDYRYEGPKPQTKEAAIVLLADSVEASSRTLTEPTPGKIRNMVQRIINNKFIDNQLDECDLTLRDLFKITEAFVRVLIAAFHVRTEYPDKREMAGIVVDKDNQSA